MELVRASIPEYNSRSPQLRIWRKCLACPYFMPVAKLDNGQWPHPARLPLGCGWTGHCTAPGHEGDTPSQDIVEAFCNLGYASGCSWAPLQRPWDAVRFSVVTPEERGGEADIRAARVLRLFYECERDHRPVTHGDLVIDLTSATWLQRHEDARVQKMAECFLDSYLKKKA
jgi:hypothetical protein